ncbi:protocadherin-like wing polarity protein stan [Pecten maximus]|uniref:protocadherin-like wing polarity protein stan n=1 Tax=Pecten maximus TaxID=6579 RepID=UPI0014589880|nr:protocadherin-like wing polarity protein stan [Pecten maximus]
MVLGGEIQTNADISALTIPGYDIYVTITDGTNTVGPRTVTVIVTGINSPPVIRNTPLTFSLSLMENSAKSASIYQINAADPDSDTLTYSITYTPATEGATVFSFDTSTGLLSTSSATVVDYESLTSKSFTADISVTDGAATDTYATFTIDVIDINEAPAFGTTIYYVTGNEGNAGESFGNPGFTVTDPDTGDTYSYTVDCTAITMDSNTGAVTLSGTYDLDISGTASVLTCTATVSDGELTDTTQLIVTINDVNDHTPAFSQSDYTIYTTIYGNVGGIIGNIAATDGDLGNLRSINLLTGHFNTQRHLLWSERHRRFIPQ